MKRRPIAPILVSLALLIPPMANLVRSILRDLRPQESETLPARTFAGPDREEEARDLARFRFTAARWLPFHDVSPLRSSGWIDRGAEAGVRPGQIVATARGALVGRVRRVYPRFAQVMLLDDPEFRVRAAARLASGEAEAIVRGNGRGGRLLAEHVAGALELPAQALLRTAGGDAELPEGLTIGYALEGGGILQAQPARASAATDRLRTVYVLADPLIEAVRTARGGAGS
ncbi:MAG: hypothetical protein JXP34_28775 [Planctomycetes bacterium]|nr:hypothetical protein [Planctomycetota bacterium]